MNCKEKKAIKLTGKAKEDFEEWIIKNNYGCFLFQPGNPGSLCVGKKILRIKNSFTTKCDFNELPFYFQKSLVVMWLDSINKNLFAISIYPWLWKTRIKEIGEFPTICEGLFNTREEAMEKGISRLIESHNIKHHLKSTGEPLRWWQLLIPKNKAS